MSSLLVIPTLNEVDGMKQVIPLIKKEWVDEILIVDGGSTDGTVEEAKKLNLKVMQQKSKGSFGAAIYDGFESTDAEYLLMFGADGNNEPEEIPKILEKMKEGYDQVLISRFGKTSINEDAGIIDAFGNKMFTSITNIFFRGQLTDTLSSSRAFTKKAWDEIKFDAFGLDSVLQMSIRGLIKNQKIIEIVGNERARVGGERKMHRIPTATRLTARIIRELFWKG
jgi:glycosyltransferase involved in cell wall biosynthesis